MINAQDFLDQVAAVTKHQVGSQKVRIGFIDYEFDETKYPQEWPRVNLDGEGMTNRGYQCISGYVPMRGDRVVLLPVGKTYVILGSVERSDRDLLVPGQLVFQATRTAVQSIPTGTTTAIIWNSATYDRIGGWSSSENSSRYTPPIPGWYEFSGTGSLMPNAGGSFRDVQWRFNGVNNGPFSHSRHAHTGTTAAAAMSARTRSYFMNGTTDYVELAINHNAGVAVDTNDGAHYQPHIEVKYVGPPAAGSSPSMLSLE